MKLLILAALVAVASAAVKEKRQVLFPGYGLGYGGVGYGVGYPGFAGYGLGYGGLGYGGFYGRKRRAAEATVDASAEETEDKDKRQVLFPGYGLGYGGLGYGGVGYPGYAGYGLGYGGLGYGGFYGRKRRAAEDNVDASAEVTDDKDKRHVLFPGYGLGYGGVGYGVGYPGYGGYGLGYGGLGYGGFYGRKRRSAEAVDDKSKRHLLYPGYGLGYGGFGYGGFGYGGFGYGGFGYGYPGFGYGYGGYPGFYGNGFPSVILRKRRDAEEEASVEHAEHEKSKRWVYGPGYGLGYGGYGIGGYPVVGAGYPGFYGAGVLPPPVIL